MKQSFKKVLISGISLASFFVAGTAYAIPANSMYVGASGDLTWMGDSNMGGGGNIAVGHRFTDWRAELEAGYHNASGGGDATHYYSYMGNAYYDFGYNVNPSAGSRITPYLGAGIGDARIHGDDQFAYQGMAGLTFASASTPNTDWTMGYRYLGTTDDSPHSHSAEVGLRYHF